MNCTKLDLAYATIRRNRYTHNANWMDLAYVANWIDLAYATSENWTAMCSVLSIFWVIGTLVYYTIGRG